MVIKLKTNFILVFENHSDDNFFCVGVDPIWTHQVCCFKALRSSSLRPCSLLL